MLRRIFMSLCFSFWIFPSYGICLEIQETSKITTVDVQTGWNLLGATTTFSPEQLRCANTVWAYDNNGSWKMFGANITDENNYNHAKLSLLEPGVGYWVFNSAQGCTSGVGGWTVMPNINEVTNFFTDILLDVNVSDIAAKRFSITMASHFEQEAQEYELQFNAYGVASVVIANTYERSFNQVWSFRFENGLLHFFVDDIYQKSYKVIAKQNGTGIIFGQVSSPISISESYGTLGHMFYVIDKTAVEQPIDMGTQVPFIVYRNHYEDIYEVFGTDGNYTEYYNNEADITQPYTIENGKFRVTSTYPSTNEEDYFDDAIFQVIYQIGRYNIMRVRFEGGMLNKSSGEKNITYSYEKIEINSPMPFLIRYEGGTA